MTMLWAARDERDGQIVSHFDGSPWTLGEWRADAAAWSPATCAGGGFHGCERLADALSYIPNASWVTRIETRGREMVGGSVVKVEEARMVAVWRVTEADHEARIAAQKARDEAESAARDTYHEAVDSLFDRPPDRVMDPDTCTPTAALSGFPGVQKRPRREDRLAERTAGEGMSTAEMRRYRVHRHTPDAVFAVDRETKCFFWEGKWRSKKTTWDPPTYFDTFEEAQAELVRLAERRVDRARQLTGPSQFIGEPYRYRRGVSMNDEGA